MTTETEKQIEKDIKNLEENEQNSGREKLDPKEAKDAKADNDSQGYMGAKEENVKPIQPPAPKTVQDDKKKEQIDPEFDPQKEITPG